MALPLKFTKAIGKPQRESSLILHPPSREASFAGRPRVSRGASFAGDLASEKTSLLKGPTIAIGDEAGDDKPPGFFDVEMGDIIKSVIYGGLDAVINSASTVAAVYGEPRACS